VVAGKVLNEVVTALTVAHRTARRADSARADHALALRMAIVVMIVPVTGRRKLRKIKAIRSKSSSLHRIFINHKPRSMLASGGVFLCSKPRENRRIPHGNLSNTTP
jgi:hypothetical protein